MVVKKTQTYILMLCKKLYSSLESEQSLSNSTLLQKRQPNCYIKTIRLFCPKKTFLLGLIFENISPIIA